MKAYTVGAFGFETFADAKDWADYRQESNPENCMGYEVLDAAGNVLYETTHPEFSW